MNERFDVVIVGSGPIGSAYARTILNEAPHATVLMLESGPQVATPPGRHVKTITDPEQLRAAQIASQGPTRQQYGTGAGTSRQSEDAAVVARAGTFLLGPTATQPGEDGMPAAAMSANVGGMGSHWTCACPWPEDDERIPFLDRAEFDALFAKSWELLSARQDAFAGAPLGDALRQALGSHLDAGRAADRRVQPMPLGIRVTDTGDKYWTGPDVILGDLLDGQHPGFELRADTTALRVRHEDGRAVGVTVRDRETGDTTDIDAAAVVVAADSFRTPQLLFASAIRPPALGRYLNDHPQVIGIVQLDDALFPDDESATGYTPSGQVDALSGVSWVPYDQERFPFHGQIMQTDASPVPIAGVPNTRPGSIVGLGFFCKKDIQPEDRIEFDETTPDWQGLPTMSIHYQLTDVDHQTITDAKTRIVELASKLGRLVNDNPPVEMPPGSSMHYMGTVRMSETDDGTGVCDPDSRVWGYDNLYVGGNGVIPTATACNPTATSVALAIRGARTLARTLGTEK